MRAIVTHKVRQPAYADAFRDEQPDYLSCSFPGQRAPGPGRLKWEPYTRIGDVARLKAGSKVTSGIKAVKKSRNLRSMFRERR